MPQPQRLQHLHSGPVLLSWQWGLNHGEDRSENSVLSEGENTSVLCPLVQTVLFISGTGVTLLALKRFLIAVLLLWLVLRQSSP